MVAKRGLSPVLMAWKSSRSVSEGGMPDEAIVCCFSVESDGLRSSDPEWRRKNSPSGTSSKGMGVNGSLPGTVQSHYALFWNRFSLDFAWSDEGTHLIRRKCMDSFHGCFHPCRSVTQLKPFTFPLEPPISVLWPSLCYHLFQWHTFYGHISLTPTSMRLVSLIDPPSE